MTSRSDHAVTVPPARSDHAVTAQPAPALDFAAWLGLREAADAAARAADLVAPLRRHLAGADRIVIHDLGTGTGGMARWLAPRLPGPQHWVLYDRDPDLLARARTGMVDRAGDATLVTASALLDMMTAEELARVVAVCADADCPALFTISVIGRVAFDPADPLDDELTEAFNAHQRRTVAGRTLLGPDAVEACVAAFARRGVPVTVRPSPWRLGADRADLIAEWLAGWLDAAREQRPELADRIRAYAGRRRAHLAAGRLAVVLQHRDILAGRRLAGRGLAEHGSGFAARG